MTSISELKGLGKSKSSKNVPNFEAKMSASGGSHPIGSQSTDSQKSSIYFTEEEAAREDSAEMEVVQSLAKAAPIALRMASQSNQSTAQIEVCSNNI